MLEKLLNLKNLGDSFYKLYQNMQSDLGFVKTQAFGMPKIARHIVASGLDKKVLYICPNKIEADEAMLNMGSLTQGDVIYLPEKPEVLVSASAFSKELLHQRLSAINEILTSDKRIIITTIEAVSGLFPNMELFRRLSFKVKKGQEISPNELVKNLVKNGYERTDLIENQGQFSLRGDIIDIYMPNGNAYRLDFWGDTLERIKTIDIRDMKSSGNIEKLDFYPICDVLIDDRERKIARENLESAIPNIDCKADEQKWYRKRAELIYEIEHSVATSRFEITTLLASTYTIFDYISSDTVVIFDEFNKCYDIAAAQYMEHKSRFTSLFEGKDILKTQLQQKLNFEEVVNLADDFPSMSLCQMLTTDKGFFPRELVEFKLTPVISYQVGNSELITDIKNWLKLKYTVVICGKDEETAKNFANNLSRDGGMVAYSNGEKDITGSVVIPCDISHGVVFHHQKIALIGTSDVMKKSSRIITSKRKKTDTFLACEVGDYVVHDIHGIGYLRAMTSVQTGDFIKDYAEVVYRDGDVLYVPAEQMDMLVKFSGSDKMPKLSKIGGKEFAKVKERVRNSLKAMAFDLKELYANREKQVGYKFQEDSLFQKEFEDNFPYQATLDQVESAEQIKADMMTNRVMDRLLVGDVGYGKTEVAFRAAFKAIESGKQVCLLAPTTILSYQHYKSAVERFKGFGIRIDYLNRFKQPKIQEETIKNLQLGKIDLVIGTHRLLSKDVEFADLGLLILDEEQRFGVEDKEKIKNLKKNIDVLSMSATPIPRTLHMSLSGIRDISTIETPPSKRLPVQVIVAEQTDSIIVDALTRELSRSGQVFVLYNRVSSIHSFTNKLQALMPEVKFIVAHGQMEPKKLEDHINEFIMGKHDVLVSTTIIENGIDIPRANTMVVVDADRFGLSQLYQLKGRVGRSDKLAYVYFLHQQNKVMTETARKRLSAIMEFTEFGSGFKIAMRDLEIRGSGNILGREQHGHMEAVGYDMYCKLLKETVDDINGKTESKIDVEVDTDISAYIKEDYITLSSARMEQYREISRISSENDMKSVINAIEDIYGKVPKEVEYLCKISLIRHLAVNIMAKKIIVKTNQVEIILSIDSLKLDKLHDVLALSRDKLTLDVGSEIKIIFFEKDNITGLSYILDFLSQIN